MAGEMIFLYGPPGSGKSTVGQMLANELNLSFTDLDKAIEKRAQLEIADIFEQMGESGFRQFEKEALMDTISHRVGIVALGGGALLNAANREVVESAGDVVCIQAPVEELISRLMQTHDPRPLIQDDLIGLLPDLLAKRKNHYDSFSLQVESSNLTPAEITWQIMSRLGRFHVRGMGRSYNVRVNGGGLQSLGECLKAYNIESSLCLVSDDHVYPIYGDELLLSLKQSGFSVFPLVIPAGETNKNMVTVEKLWEGFLQGGLERQSIVIALGGGVVTDLAGFAAATFMRGVSWIAVPTSLLAMVDASLGGKTGADLPQGKNLVGAFHSPRLVFADPMVLRTLPQSEIRSGLAEVVKAGVIGDPTLFELCRGGIKTLEEAWEPIVSCAMAVKIKIIQNDPYEQGIRAALNFGHTIGHALEQLSDFSLPHGFAVSIGMVVETRLSCSLGCCSSDLLDNLMDVLTRTDLPTEIPKGINPDEILKTIQVDKKKSRGMVKFALPVKLGEVKTGLLVDENLLSNVLKQSYSRLDKSRSN